VYRDLVVYENLVVYWTCVFYSSILYTQLKNKIDTTKKKKDSHEVYESGFSMPSLTKTMKWTFSVVSQKEAVLDPPSLASIW